jgi:hypothetical protein
MQFPLGSGQLTKEESEVALLGRSADTPHEPEQLSPHLPHHTPFRQLSSVTGHLTGHSSLAPQFRTSFIAAPRQQKQYGGNFKPLSLGTFNMLGQTRRRIPTLLFHGSGWSPSMWGDLASPLAHLPVHAVGPSPPVPCVVLSRPSALPLHYLPLRIQHAAQKLEAWSLDMEVDMFRIPESPY